MIEFDPDELLDALDRLARREGLVARLDRGGERQAAVVRLDCAHGDQRVGTLCQRVGDEELELARLVAALRQSEQVIALEVDVGATEMAGKMGHLFERCCAIGVTSSCEFCQVHATLANAERILANFSNYDGFE